MKIYRKSKVKELFNFDKDYLDSHIVIGVDEVGRGPVAGPVVASAVYFPDNSSELLEALKYLDDSKKFSSNQALRKLLSEEIKKYAEYSICECSVEEIEKYNIFQASLIAMKKACIDLLSRIEPDKEPLILVDGKFIIKNYSQKQVAVVKGDSKSASIASASILAKVYRDRKMKELSKLYPYYDWAKNKGYPTKTHLAAVKEHGHCEIHRKSFLRKILFEQLKLQV